jgi:hypothetical protein
LYIDVHEMDIEFCGNDYGLSNNDWLMTVKHWCTDERVAWIRHADHVVTSICKSWHELLRQATVARSV